MAWVITRLCRDCVDASCSQVCPVDCIYQFTGSDSEAFPNQLFIDPQECIDCGVCEPECPWEAIYPEDEVPDVFAEDVELNARIGEAPEDRSSPQREDKPLPAPKQVQENKQRWGFVA